MPASRRRGRRSGCPHPRRGHAGDRVLRGRSRRAHQASDGGARSLRPGGSPGGITIMHASGLGNEAGLVSDLLPADGLLKPVVIGHYGMTPKLRSSQGRTASRPTACPRACWPSCSGRSRPAALGWSATSAWGTLSIPETAEAGWTRRGRADRRAGDPRRPRMGLLPPRYPSGSPSSGKLYRRVANLSMHKEPARRSEFMAAAAARNTGRIVAAQAKRLVAAHSLPAREVVVPGHLVDYIVIDPEQTQRPSTPTTPPTPARYWVPLAGITDRLDAPRRIIGERAFLELRPGFVANLGFDLPDAVAGVAFERDALDDITFTVEQGDRGHAHPGARLWGGVEPRRHRRPEPASRLRRRRWSRLTCLGSAEIDAAGCVDHPQVAGRVFGVGGSSTSRREPEDRPSAAPSPRAGCR